MRLKVYAWSLGGNRHLILRCIGIVGHLRKEGQGGKGEAVAAAIEMLERHLGGHNEACDGVVGKVAIRHQRAVTEVDGGEVVVAEVHRQDIVGILQRKFGQLVASKIEMVDGAHIVELYLRNAVVAEVDVGQEGLLIGIVDTANVERREVVARQDEFAQVSVVAQVDVIEPSAHQSEVAEAARL